MFLLRQYKKGRKLSISKRDFDKEAATWETPPRVKLAGDVASAIVRHVPLTPDMDILDFGCGTGLVSLALRPKVRSVTGVDSSSGMLDVFNEKISRGHISRIKTFHLDLDQGASLPGFYHVIVTNMTLHHIKNVKMLLSKFTAAIFSGGCLAVTDLDPEGGLFHDNHDGVFHHGFDREALRRMFAEAGLAHTRDFLAAEVVKPNKGGRVRSFSIFLMTGQKNSANK
jgi:2-polyprenyl-3-methyl-5-hydroxy-6-metoxy-1,4-benzoquinol methylase